MLLTITELVETSSPATSPLRGHQQQPRDMAKMEKSSFLGDGLGGPVYTHFRDVREHMTKCLNARVPEEYLRSHRRFSPFASTQDMQGTQSTQQSPCPTIHKPWRLMSPHKGFYR